FSTTRHEEGAHRHVKIGNVFSELKRRNVYQVAIAYLVVAWLLMQAASIFLPAFNAPQWAMQIVILILVVGFPIALVFSWAFEITPEGLKRTTDVDLLYGHGSGLYNWQ